MEEITIFRKGRIQNLFMVFEIIGYSQMTNSEIISGIWRDRKKDMPPEYLNRKKKQGLQIWYRFLFGKREVIVLTAISVISGEIKISYRPWVFIRDVETRDVLLFSFPILKTESYFETIFEYAQAFKEIITNWPVCPQCGEELRLEHIKGILNLMKFECHNKTVKHTQRRPSFLIINAPFSKNTVLFLRLKFIPDYRRQVRNKKENKEVKSRRVNRSLKREEAKLKETLPG